MQLKHLQLNIKNTMTATAIKADVDKAFSLDPDTIVFNECQPVHRAEIKLKAAELGYGVYIPGRGGNRGQVVLVWKSTRFDLIFRKSVLAAPGRAHVQPTRYVQRVALVDKETKERIALVGTHTVASGWTGKKWLDAWRRANWQAQQVVLAGILRWTVRHNRVVVWSGDMNRPAKTFKNGKLFPLLHPKGLDTDLIVKTDGTHGVYRYDYVGVLAKARNVKVVSWETPSFNSDHDGVLVDLEWCS